MEKSEKTKLQQALSLSRGLFVVVGLFSLFINGLLLTVPLYMLQVYDRVLASRSLDTLLMLTIAAVIMLVTVGVVDVARSRVLVRLGARLDGLVNEPLLSAMLLSRLRGQGASTGQPLTDLEALRIFLTGSGLLSFFDAPWTPFFIALIFVFHPMLGFVALAGAVIIFLLAILSELATRRPLRESARISLRADGFVESSLRNAEAIQAMGMMPGLLKRWRARHRPALALQALASDRAAAIISSAKVIRQLLQIAILGTGAYLAVRQAITPGVMLVTSLITARALAPVEAAISSWRPFIGARAAYGRLDDLLKQADPRGESMRLPKPTGTLSVENLIAAPPGVRKPVIAGVSFSLSEGEMLGLIGPSAVGKSTLARLLVGVWAPISGHVRLDGADVHQWDHEALGPHIGYLPQDVELFDGTVSENIARFSVPDPELVVEAARQARAHDMILRLPSGYDTSIGEGGGVLSGGQRQRIALARALYGDPTLIVLDEPNSNLDGEGEEALRAAIAELKARRKTMVVIAHRPSVIGAADRVLLLRNGVVQTLGPPAEVLPRVMHAPVDEDARTVLRKESQTRVAG
jgi:PrtD family type I secretion system ABC transporter